MEEIQQNTEETLEKLEEEQNQEYIQTDFESDESCSSEDFLKFGFTLCKAEQPLQVMELQEKEAQKD